MSGAAGIAAAKNRRSKPDPSQSPVISCSNVKPGSLSSSKQGYKAVPTLFDEESLQITGPMHVMQVLKVHEQRLNKIDEKINKVASPQQACLPQACLPQACVPQLTAAPEQACDAECYERLSVLEEKVLMLEEVIMNLQLTLTNVQSFAMESSLAMLKLQNQLAAAAPTVPAPTAPAPLVPAPLAAEVDTLSVAI
jgi:hypothetical protein